MTNGEIAKELTSFAAPLVSAVIDTWVKPLLEQWRRERKLNADLYDLVPADGLRSYLTRAYETHSYLSTIVLQSRPQLLKKLYLPLTIAEAYTQDIRQPARRGRTPQTPTEANSFLIDGYPENLFKHNTRIRLVDQAGMGKSTVLKRMFLGAVDANVGIPVLLSLRHLSREQSLVHTIQGMLSTLTRPVSIDLVHQLLSRGDFVFFLDGYDEIPLQERDAVLRDLNHTFEVAPANKYLIASRPDDALLGLPHFSAYHIVRLTTSQAYELLGRYDDGGPVSTSLIATLREKQYQTATETFLENPLLTSLLFRAFQYKHIVPLQTHVFFRQVYDALYETHDLTKGEAFVRNKVTGLGIEEFHRVVRRFAFDTSKRLQVEYTRDEVAEYLSTAITNTPGCTCRTGDLLSDLLGAVPLLQHDGTNVRWCHKAMQDYFAAQCVCTDSQDLKKEILKRLATGQNVQRFQNVLALCYGIDYPAFRESIIAPMAQRFIQYLDALAQCIPHADTHIRQSLAALSDGRLIVIVSTESRRTSEIVHALRRELGLSRMDEPLRLRKVSQMLSVYTEPLVDRESLRLIGQMRDGTVKRTKDYLLRIKTHKNREAREGALTALESWMGEGHEDAIVLGIPAARGVPTSDVALEGLVVVLAQLIKDAHDFCFDEDSCRRLLGEVEREQVNRPGLLEGL